MKAVGKTTDGLVVVQGVGALCFSKGVPLEVVLTYFQEQNLIVDWVDYITTAFNDGHNPRTIRARIDSAVSDVLGKDIACEIMIRTDKILEILK